MKRFMLIMILAVSLVNVRSDVNTDSPNLACKNVTMEICITMDISRSMSYENFSTSLLFLQNLVGRFEISSAENGVRVAVQTYSELMWPDNSFGLKYYNTTAEVVQRISKMSQSVRYLADHNEALQMIIHTLRRGRPGVARVGIVLTDEKSQRPLDKRYLRDLRKNKFIMFAIGVGLSDLTELNEIAGTENRVFAVKSFDQLNSIVETLANQTCLEAEESYPDLEPIFERCENKSIEIGIVLDSSASLKPADYQSAIKFLQKVLSKFEINPEQNQIRVSIIPFGLGIYRDLSFNLNTYNTTNQVVQAIGNIPFKFGGYTDTGKGIEHMRTVQMANSIVRPGVKKVGIVLTDGNSQRGLDTKKAAEAARQEGIIMYAVGVGEAITYDELHNIAGHSKRVILMADYGRHERNVHKLANRTCFAGEEPLRQICNVDTRTDIFFLFSPVDLGSRSYIEMAASFVNLSINNEAMQDGFRYGLMSSECDVDFGLNLSTCGDVGNIEQSLNQYTESNLKKIAKKLARNSFTLGNDSNRNRKIAVLVSQSSVVGSLADEVKELTDKNIQVFIACIDGSNCILSGTKILTHDKSKDASRILSDQLVKALVIKIDK